jgi:hypothetical protein
MSSQHVLLRDVHLLALELSTFIVCLIPEGYELHLQLPAWLHVETPYSIPFISFPSSALFRFLHQVLATFLQCQPKYVLSCALALLGFF